MTRPFGGNVAPIMGFDPTNIAPITTPDVGARLSDDDFNRQRGELTRLHDDLNAIMITRSEVAASQVGHGVLKQQMDGYSGYDKALAKDLAYAQGEQVKKSDNGTKARRKVVRQGIVTILQDTDMQRMMTDFLDPTFDGAHINEHGAANNTTRAGVAATTERGRGNLAAVELSLLHLRNLTVPLPPLSSAPQMARHLPQAYEFGLQPGESLVEGAVRTAGDLVEHYVDGRRWCRERKQNDRDTADWEATVNAPHRARNSERANAQVATAQAEIRAQGAERAALRDAHDERHVRGWTTELGKAYNKVLNDYLDNREEVAITAVAINAELDAWPLDAGPGDVGFDAQRVSDLQAAFEQQGINIDALPLRDSGRAEDLRGYNQARYRFEARRIGAGIADPAHGYESIFTAVAGERAIVVNPGAMNVEVFYEDGSTARYVPGTGMVRRSTDGEEWTGPARVDRTFPVEYDDRATTPTVVLRAYALGGAERFEASLDPRAEIEALAMNYAYTERLDENMTVAAEGYRVANDALTAIATQRTELIDTHRRERAELAAATPDPVELARLDHELRLRQTTEVTNFDVTNQPEINRQWARRDANERIFRLSGISLAGANGWMARLEVTAPGSVRAEHGGRTAQMLPNGNVLWQNAVMHNIRGTWEINLAGQAELLDFSAGLRYLYETDGTIVNTRPI